MRGKFSPTGRLKGVAYERAKGGRVTSETFLSRFDETAKRLNAAKATPAFTKVGSDAAKPRANAKAVARANEAVTSSVSDALAHGYIKAETVLGIVETVAKAHGIPLPTSIGFDPAGCTIAECDLVASTMFQAGKYTEMVRLRDRLDLMVAAADKALPSPVKPNPASLKIA